MDRTDITAPSYFHKVVDCQWACPAHTPVPEYIRLIAQGRYTDAFMINWESNVFPGILGRTCDRPCEPACRRGRIEEKPVAICRLKRVAADKRGPVDHLLPRAPAFGNGKRIAMIGAGPASLTVARDLLPLGYECVLIERDPQGGGLMRKNIPSFRLPVDVLDEEVGRILDMGATTRFGTEITSMKSLLDEGFDAVFVGTGAPRGKDLRVPGRAEADDNIHIGIDFLSSVAFKHIEQIGKRVVVIGGGNTAMDCCRTALRMGADSVHVTVRSPRADMKASDWEIEDAEREGIPILDNHSPKEFVLKDGKLTAVVFERMRAEYDDTGRRKLIPTGEPDVVIECDDVLMAVGQENSFPWIERDLGIEFNDWEQPIVDKQTFQSTLPERFLRRGRRLGGPRTSSGPWRTDTRLPSPIDLFCRDAELTHRPPPMINLVSQKMGIHEWSYDNRHLAGRTADRATCRFPRLPFVTCRWRVELGFDERQALEEAQRCLNCDIQTVFTDKLCIECDACMDICPVDCINFTQNGGEEEGPRKFARSRDEHRSGSLCFGSAGHGPGDDQGRGCMPALRALR